MKEKKEVWAFFSQIFPGKVGGGFFQVPTPVQIGGQEPFSVKGLILHILDFAGEAKLRMNINSCIPREITNFHKFFDKIHIQ